ncbi:hypothetical protein BV25DRAFT_1921179 [Artomyces pyxidatus]|uniref:Uncharacterized protein n=1 Tax=Artomyces pyxidatus TaxID=48021 RepID=A0ACB8SJB4_9AGAM|nr:hypothetical protein BV25DRAFT_1921179 [Artomyces pyxidatus]
MSTPSVRTATDPVATASTRASLPPLPPLLGGVSAGTRREPSPSVTVSTPPSSRVHTSTAPRRASSIPPSSTRPLRRASSATFEMLRRNGTLSPTLPTSAAKGKGKALAEQPTASSCSAAELSSQPSFSLSDVELSRLHFLLHPADVKTVAKSIDFLSNIVASHIARPETNIAKLRADVSDDRDADAVILASLRRDLGAIEA